MGDITRTIMLAVAFSTSPLCYGQVDERISTIDFVEILNNNKEEAVYYYENNWKILRERAIEKNYIESYDILETPWSEQQPFHMMLITTYANKEQYDLREDHFGELIKQKGGLNLMNGKKPNEFRNNLFNKETVRHWAP